MSERLRIWARCCTNINNALLTRSSCLAFGMLISSTMHTVSSNSANVAKARGTMALSTVWSKLNDETLRDHTFDHPFVQTVCMFLGDFLCLLGHMITKNRRTSTRRERPAEVEPVAISELSGSIDTCWLISHAICNMCGTGVMYAGLCLSSAFAFEVWRVCCFLNFTYDVPCMRGISAFWQLVASRVFNVFSMLLSFLPWFSSQGVSLTGMLPVFISQACFGLQRYIEEKHLNIFQTAALKAIGLEGACCFFIFGTLLIPMYYIHFDGCALENAPDAFAQVRENWVISVAMSGSIISRVFVNVFSVSIATLAKNGSVSNSMVFCSTRVLLVWATSLALSWERFHWVVIAGLVVLVLGSVVCDKIIMLPCLFKYQREREEPRSIVSDGDHSTFALRAEATQDGLLVSPLVKGDPCTRQVFAQESDFRAYAVVPISLRRSGMVKLSRRRDMSTVTEEESFDARSDELQAEPHHAECNDFGATVSVFLPFGNGQVWDQTVVVLRFESLRGGWEEVPSVVWAEDGARFEVRSFCYFVIASSFLYVTEVTHREVNKHVTVFFDLNPSPVPGALNCRICLKKGKRYIAGARLDGEGLRETGDSLNLWDCCVIFRPHSVRWICALDLSNCSVGLAAQVRCFIRLAAPRTTTSSRRCCCLRSRLEADDAQDLFMSYLIIDLSRSPTNPRASVQQACVKICASPCGLGILVGGHRLVLPDTCTITVVLAALKLALYVAKSGVGEGQKAKGFLIVLGPKRRLVTHPSVLASQQEQGLGTMPDPNKYEYHAITIIDITKNGKLMRFMLPDFTIDGAMIINGLDGVILAVNYSITENLAYGSQEGGKKHVAASAISQAGPCFVIKCSEDHCTADHIGAGYLSVFHGSAEAFKIHIPSATIEDTEA